MKHTVPELTPDMSGRWLVRAQGSMHIWDLDEMSYIRLPGPHSLSGPFKFDGAPQIIRGVDRWPAVGSTSLLWFEDTVRPGRGGRWRQSSLIDSIEALGDRTIDDVETELKDYLGSLNAELTPEQAHSLRATARLAARIRVVVDDEWGP